MLAPLKDFDWTFANVPAGKLIQAIISSGCDSEDDKINRKARIINALCLVTAFLCFTIAPLLYYITGYKSVLIPGLIEGALFFTTILFNRYHFYRAASLGVLAIHLISALYFGLLLGKDAGVVIIVAFIFALCFLIYDEMVESWIGASLAFLTYVLLEAGYYLQVVTPIQLSPLSQNLVRWIAIPCFFFLLAIIILHYARENRLLQYLNKAYGRNTAHDQRVNINAGMSVTNSLQEVVRKSPALSQVYPYIKLFESILEDMHEAANNRLSSAEIESGKQLKITADAFSHKDLLERFIEIKGVSAMDKGKKLVLKIQENFPEIIIADPYHLKNIYANLMSNAIKYSDESSPIYVDVKMIEPGNRFSFSVTNKCPDIPTRTLGKLFSLYETNPNNKGVESSGVGLYIVENTVKAMGGNITASSSGGETTFTVTLPLITGTAIKATDKTEAEIRSLNLQGIQVLLAEDNSLIFYDIKNKLQALGCEVLGFKDGNSCLHALEANQCIPNVIFLDKNLPVINGRTILKFIKQNPFLNQIPVFMVSGDFSNDQKLDLMEIGASGFILKPVTSKDLYTAFLLIREGLQQKLKHA